MKEHITLDGINYCLVASLIDKRNKKFKLYKSLENHRKFAIQQDNYLYHEILVSIHPLFSDNEARLRISIHKLLDRLVDYKKVHKEEIAQYLADKACSESKHKKDESTLRSPVWDDLKYVISRLFRLIQD